MACAAQNKDISPSAAARLVTRAWLPRPASEQQKAGAAAEGKTLTSIHGLLPGDIGDSVSRLPGGASPCAATGRFRRCGVSGYLQGHLVQLIGTA